MRKISLFAAMRSGIGNIRTNNEDSCYFNGEFADLDNMDQEKDRYEEFHDGQAMFAVCDGMGGYENGEVASYTAVSRMPELQKELLTADFGTTVTQWVEETNSEIREKARDGGCTLALLFYKSERIHIAHIGDSRIYRYHQGALSRMTKDHSKLQVLLDAGIITEKEAETYPHKHVITRALGMNEEDSGRCTPTIREPVLAEDGDWYIICSDGVTDMLADNQIASILSQAETAEDCAGAIYREALKAGGKDNTSVIAIRIECEDQGSYDPDQRDELESTWTPEPPSVTMPVSIEQFTTIQQINGQKFTIRTSISHT